MSLLHFVIVCEKDKDPIRELLKVQAAHLFPSYNKILVLIIGKFISVFATFAWNFVDVFNIMISIGLSTIFKLYNEELRRSKCEVKFRLEKKKKFNQYFHFQNNSVDYWIYRRSQYGKLRHLVATVDKKVTQLTLISFTNLFFFTCKQLYFGISRCN